MPRVLRPSSLVAGFAAALAAAGPAAGEEGPFGWSLAAGARLEIHYEYEESVKRRGGARGREASGEERELDMTWTAVEAVDGEGRLEVAIDAARWTLETPLYAITLRYAAGAEEPFERDVDVRRGDTDAESERRQRLAAEAVERMEAALQAEYAVRLGAAGEASLGLVRRGTFVVPGRNAGPNPFASLLAGPPLPASEDGATRTLVDAPPPLSADGVLFLRAGAGGEAPFVLEVRTVSEEELRARCRARDRLREPQRRIDEELEIDVVFAAAGHLRECSYDYELSLEKPDTPAGPGLESETERKQELTVELAED